MPARVLLPSVSDRARAAFLTSATLSEAMVDRLWGEGIEDAAIVRTALGHPNPIGCARVAVDGMRFVFDPARAERDGVTAFVFLALDCHGEPDDVVAWRPGEGGFLASRYGQAALLGAEMIGAPALGCPLRVFRDVLSWLRGCRSGVVIVDPIGAAPLLREVGALIADDRQHAAALRSALAIPPPRVEVASAVPVLDRVPALRAA